MTERKRRISPVTLVVVAVIIVLAVVGTRFLPGQPQQAADPDHPLSLQMLDVGNADCLLLRQGEHFMLIDAGEADTADEVVSALREQGVQRLEMVIATHPHADHIGGMATVIQAFPIDRFILQPVPESLTPTSAAYRRMLDALEEKTEIDITDATEGGTFALGEAQVTVFPLLDEYEDLNNYSVVTRVTYGDCAFLLMGDAEEPVEKAILASGRSVAANVLKVGHHGSSTSSSSEFLRAVHPEVALIPCGAGNAYGHPHETTVEKLQDVGAEIHRSDINGDVAVSTDGSRLIVADENKQDE